MARHAAVTAMMRKARNRGIRLTRLFSRGAYPLRPDSALCLALLRLALTLKRPCGARGDSERRPEREKHRSRRITAQRRSIGSAIGFVQGSLVSWVFRHRGRDCRGLACAKPCRSGIPHRQHCRVSFMVCRFHHGECGFVAGTSGRLRRMAESGLPDPFKASTVCP